MIKIHDHYPNPDEIMIRMDLFLKAPDTYEGGALFAGKDSKGVEYKPKNPPKQPLYSLPSNSVYGVAMGEHPAIQYPFKLELDEDYPSSEEISDPGVFEGPLDINLLRMLNLTVFDADRNEISLNEKVESIFKELASLTMLQGGGNHSWAEYYMKRTPTIEKFLEQYRL